MMDDVSKKKFYEAGLGCLVESKLEAYFKALNGAPPSSGLYTHIIQEVEKPLISMTLRYTSGNKVKAAALLGINRNTLYKKIRELSLVSKVNS